MGGCLVWTSELMSGGPGRQKQEGDKSIDRGDGTKRKEKEIAEEKQQIGAGCQGAGDGGYTNTSQCAALQTSAFGKKPNNLYFFHLKASLSQAQDALSLD